MTELRTRFVALERGLRLEAITVGWMAVEAALSIGAGIAARSVLLTAFGADSLIELISAITVYWRLRIERRGGDGAAVDAVEHRATWMSAVLLILLTAYVVVTSIGGLVVRFAPERSWLGVTVAAFAVIVMPWLAREKRIVNGTLQSPSLRADIVESATCAYLAGVTLIGVGLDALTGWWWIEYLAALVLLRWLVPETREVLGAARSGKPPHHND